MRKAELYPKFSVQHEDITHIIYCEALWYKDHSKALERLPGSEIMDLRTHLDIITMIFRGGTNKNIGMDDMISWELKI